jgi:hypothetical protein
MYSLRYNDFLAPIVKSIQQQQAIIEKQESEIKELKMALKKLSESKQ